VSSAKPSSLRLVATLSVAGLLSGAALVGIYLWTLPTIRANRQAALERAITNVLPGTVGIDTLELVDDSLRETEAPATDGGAPRVYRGRDGAGTALGYAIPADGPGFMDTIGLIYGYDPAQRRIVGLEVLESRETPGLGDKIITDEDFLANFERLLVDPEIVPVKQGAGEADNEVDCITGATISSEAVVGILNRSTREWGPRLEPEPPPPAPEGGAP
jgi:electron transport complex protein RnfG